MQTTSSQISPWRPVTPTRSSWPQALGWYLAGVLATCAGGALVVGIGSVTGGAFAGVFGHLLVLGAIIVLVKRTGRLPRRSGVALVLGVLTPFVLAAAVVAYFLWALAHSNLSF